MSHRSLFPAALLAAVMVAGGCESDGWKKNRGDVNAVKEGWDDLKVQSRLGTPKYIIPGEGLRTGWEEWVYPNGSVFLYRSKVVHVLKRSPGTPMPPEPKAAWDLPLPE